MEFWQDNGIKPISTPNLAYKADVENLNNNIEKEDNSSAFENYFTPSDTSVLQSDFENTDEYSQAWGLSLLLANSQNAHALFENQNQNDGVISQSYNAAKEFLNLGISDKDIKKALDKEDKNLKRLQAAYNDDDGKNFEKVYKEITGVDFNSEKIFEYQQKSTELNFVQLGIDKANNFTKAVQNSKSTQELYDNYLNYYKDDKKAKQQLSDLIKDSCNTSLDFGSTDEVKIDDDNNIIIIQEGIESNLGNLFNFDIDSPQFSARLNINYDKKYQNEYISQFEKATGLNYEALKEDYIKLHDEAIGNADSVYNLVKKYSNDQESFISKVGMVSQMSGMALMVGASFLSGGVAPLAMGAGQVLALSGMYSDNLLETTDIITSENNKDLSRYKKVLDDTLLDTGLLVSGSMIGGISKTVSGNILKISDSTVKSIIGEIGVDGSLSLLTDYILTGQVDLSSEAFSQFMGIVTGVSASKNMFNNEKIILTDNIKERTDNLNKMALNASNVEGIRTPLFERLENIYLNDVNYNETIVKSAKNKTSTYNLDRITQANDYLNGGENYKKLMQYANEISSEASKPQYIISTMEDLAAALELSKQGGVQETSQKGIYALNAENELISGRTKGLDSTSSKLENKIIKLNSDMPQDIIEARNLIGDLQGTRLVFDSNKIQIDTSKIEVEGIAQADRTTFFEYIKNNNTQDLPKEKIELFETYRQDGLLALAEAQSSEFVEKFAKAIESGEIKISEINNYAPKDGIAYLSTKQVDRLKSAYTNWFNDTLQKAKEGSNNYQVIEKQGKTFLYDPELDVEFKSELDVITAYVDEKAHRNNGYTCAQFNLYNKFGQSEEFQFRGQFANGISECEHVIYDIRNNKKTVASSDYDKLREGLKILKEFSAEDEYDKYLHDCNLYARQKELGVSGITRPNIDDYEGIKNAFGKAKDKYGDYNIQLLSLEGIEELKQQIKQKANDKK